MIAAKRPAAYARIKGGKESSDELVANIREAIAGVLEVMKERGARPQANIQILDVAV